MKILLQYLKPYKLLVTLVLVLAAMNIGFSLIDPIIFGKLVNLANDFIQSKRDSTPFTEDRFYWSFDWSAPGVVYLLLCSIGVAMVSRIAKNFQDYFLSVIVQKFGAKVFTDGLQHAMKLPYHEFEDQRSGETLSILQKVRTDTERFVSNFVN
ncbi:MAG TPA: ABC transporter transmembrane domain-containing protein, partial [Chitinophagaceae bacterium]|nr:ABC transporter transmembrane domain-containing protein [Chitinophagaceae bacterium]